jgi:hypothetical protein
MWTNEKVSCGSLYSHMVGDVAYVPDMASDMESILNMAVDEESIVAMTSA